MLNQVNSAVILLIIFLPLCPSTSSSTSCYYKYLADFSLLGHLVYYNSIYPECQVHNKHWVTQFISALPLFLPVPLYQPLDWKWAQTGSMCHTVVETKCTRTLVNSGRISLSFGDVTGADVQLRWVPVLKMRSHAAVWSCHVLVLRLLCSSTGVTIIMPKVLIICRRRTKERKKKD